jgi:hypothetical protein
MPVGITIFLCVVMLTTTAALGYSVYLSAKVILFSKHPVDSGKSLTELLESSKKLEDK